MKRSHMHWTRTNPSGAATWCTLTMAGRAFNMSAVATGQLLKDQGWRLPDGTPTEQSLHLGRARSTPLQDGRPFYRWNTAGLHALFEQVLGRPPISQQEQEIGMIRDDFLGLVKSEAGRHGLGAAKTGVFQYDGFFRALSSVLKRRSRGVRAEMTCRVLEEIGPNLNSINPERFATAAGFPRMIDMRAEYEQKLFGASGARDRHRRGSAKDVTAMGDVVVRHHKNRAKNEKSWRAWHVATRSACFLTEHSSH